MHLQKIMNQLSGPYRDRHRLVVDSQLAELVHFEGGILDCILNHPPQSHINIMVYLGFTDIEDQALKTGQYHFSGEIIKAERGLGTWRIAIKVHSQATDIINRRSDRWLIRNVPIAYQRAGDGRIRKTEIIDLCAEGIGIERDENFQIGEILAISGLALGMQIQVPEPIHFEVRALPTPKKAGLMLTAEASVEMKTKLMDFSIQLRQTNRFWNNFLEIMRMKLGKPTSSTILPSVDFVAKQLRRRVTTLKLLVDEVQFEELTASLEILERFDWLAENIAQLETEKSKLEPLSNGKRQILSAFLDQQNKGN